MTKYVLNNVELEIPDSNDEVMHINLGYYNIENSTNIHERGSFIWNVIANPFKIDEYALTLVKYNPEMSLAVARQVICNLINTCANSLPETVLNIRYNLHLVLEERFREIAPVETGFNMDKEDIDVLVNIFVLRLYVKVCESVYDPKDFSIDGTAEYSERVVNQILKETALKILTLTL